jgi:hypothetical protein
MQAGQGQVVARVLDNLADEIKYADSALRNPDPQRPGSATRQAEGCDPPSVVELVRCDLSRRGIKSDFGTGRSGAALREHGSAAFDEHYCLVSASAGLV